MMSEDGSTVTVRNPLLLVMQAQAEKEKIRERRRKIRAERRKERERRRGSGQQHVRPTTYTPPPPLIPTLPGTSSTAMVYTKKNDYDPKNLGLKGKGLGMMAPTGARRTSSNGKGGSNSDSEVGTRRGKKEELANGNSAMSPAQQLLMRMYQKKAAAANRAKGKEEEAKAAVERTPQQEKLVAEVAKRVHEAESTGEEYLVESDLHEICDWLASLKLPIQDYLEPLVMEGFDNMHTIRLLQEEDLTKHVGITKTGHRKKIMHWVHRNRPEGYFDMMSDAEQDEDQDDYNIMSELNFSSSDSSASVVI